MSKAMNNIRVGIYLCNCDGKISAKYDLNKLKTAIQSEAEFDYIRVTDTLCSKLEQERLEQEISKYSLNRLLIVGCSDPFIERQLMKIAKQQGISRYEVEFLDLSQACAGQQNTETAVYVVNQTLKKIQLRALVGMEELDVSPEVLVVGAGKDGATVALAIAKLQPVTIIGEAEGLTAGILAVSGKKGIVVKSEARMVGLAGFPGSFSVELVEKGKSFKKNFGAVVLALEAQPVFDQSKYPGIEQGEQIQTLSQFLNSTKEFSGQKVTFVLGKADTDSLISAAAVLRKAIELTVKGALEVSILYDDMKISADELEQDYQHARARGVNFLKYSGDLKYYSTVVAATVEYKEPFLPISDSLRLASDVLVLAEDFAPAHVSAELAEMMQINLGPSGFFQEDNVHFLPIKSNREGIFFVGSCHGPIYDAELNKEVEAVAAEVGQFASGKVSVPALQPRVDAEKCAVCLTCYRTCPHHAIEIVHYESLNNMYHSAASMNPLACRHCGICAGECPGKAIQLPLYSDQEVLLEVEKPLEIVAYACENSGALAAEFAKQLEPEMQSNLQIVRVPCSGKIDALYILKALERGASGVMLCVCHKENCKFVSGNERAEKRKEQVRNLLNQIGIESERVDLVHVAANQGNQFNTAIRDMAERIHQLGINPGKVRK